MRDLNRFLLTLCFLVLPLTPMHAAEELKKIKVTVPVISLAYFPLFAGIERGLFAKQGLDVEIISTSGDGPDVDALIAGSVEFTVSTPNRLMTAYEQGKPLWGIINLANRFAIDCWINKEIAAQLDITVATPLERRVKALKGMVVAGTRPGAFTYLLLVGYARRFGLEPQKDLQIVGIGGGPSMIPAVENKQVALACSGSPAPELAISRGKSIMFTDNVAGKDAEFDNFLFQVMYVRPDFAKANPEVVRSMTRGVLEAIAFTLDAPDAEQLPVLKKYYSGIPEDILSAALKNMKGVFKRDGRITEEEVNKTSKFLIQTGALTKMAPAAEITTNQFLP